MRDTKRAQICVIMSIAAACAVAGGCSGGPGSTVQNGIAGGGGSGGQNSVAASGSGGGAPPQASGGHSASTGNAGSVAAPGAGGAGGHPPEHDAGAVPSVHDAGAQDTTCDPGTTTTQWATGCATTPKTCKDGKWMDPGSTTGDPLQCESAHFAVHAPAGTINATQCMAATAQLENVIWPAYFGSPILFPEPYCDSTTKYKASIVVHSDSGLTGGGWGNGYMGMWVGPGATADHWGLAHEFMHAVQSTTHGLSCGGAQSNNFCGWIYESHANFMPHQLAEFRGNVHCSEMLVNAPHMYLGSTRDRYCNWQFMEFLKDKYCYEAVNDIWTAPQTSNDPFTNIASTRGWSTSQLNDFFGEWAMHDVTWDYQNPPPATGNQGDTYRSNYGAVTDTSKPERRLRTTRLETLDAGMRRYAVPPLQAPQRWGYDIVRLYPDAGASQVTVTFRGVTQDGADSDWRWGLVATDTAITKPRYSALQHGADAELTFCMNAGESLFLVVMATPGVQQHILWDELYPKIHRYPYMVQLAGAQPEGYQDGAPNPSPNGMRFANGGGWVATGANVAAGAYVGPFAAVLGGTVGASARIEDHAVVVGGTVMSGSVSGLTVLARGYTLDGSASVKLSWPYGPGWFENPQTLSGSVSLFGDVELRGANRNESSGKDCGFVDVGMSNNCDVADVTVAPPYTWRP
jgi:hypothetical protein